MQIGWSHNSAEEIEVSLFRLDGKVAVVTGSSSGIGYATALEMARQGASVVITGVTSDDPAGASRRLNEEIGRDATRPFVLDLADATQAKPLIDEAIREFGRLDVLALNGALVTYGGPERLDPDEMDATLTGNLRTNLMIARAALPEMRKVGGGSIMITSSTMSQIYAPQTFAYSLAKAGVIQWAKLLAVHAGRDNIRVNAIVPGLINTRLNYFLAENPEVLKPFTDQIPLGYMGEPSDLAAAMVFLASDAARYITGQALAVDGGQVLAAGRATMDSLNAQEESENFKDVTAAEA